MRSDSQIYSHMGLTSPCEWDCGDDGAPQPKVFIENHSEFSLVSSRSAVDPHVHRLG